MDISLITDPRRRTLLAAMALATIETSEGLSDHGDLKDIDFDEVGVSFRVQRIDRDNCKVYSVRDHSELTAAVEAGFEDLRRRLNASLDRMLKLWGAMEPDDGRRARAYLMRGTGFQGYVLDLMLIGHGLDGREWYRDKLRAGVVRGQELEGRVVRFTQVGNGLELMKTDPAWKRLELVTKQ